LQLVEIPTASDELMARAREERRVETPPTVAQLQASFLQGFESALEGLRLPQPARLVSYRVMTAADAPVDIAVAYLSEREIGPDAQSLIAEEIKARLDFPSSNVGLIWIEESLSLPPFGRNQSEIGEPTTALIDRIGSTLRQYPRLGIEVNTGTANAEREEMARERGEAILDYLVSKWGVAQERILLKSTDVGQTAEIRISIAK
jgi:hypothetical protein